MARAEKPSQRERVTGEGEEGEALRAVYLADQSSQRFITAVSQPAKDMQYFPCHVCFEKLCLLAQRQAPRFRARRCRF